MKLKLQTRIAARVLKCSPSRVRFDSDKLSDIKEAITKADMRGLVKQKIVSEKPEQGISKSRQRKTKSQKKKGRQRGYGSRKGRASARDASKRRWMRAIRAQRSFLKEIKMKGLISAQDFNELYRKAKGGFFRSTRHIKVYATEKNMFRKK